MMALTEVGMSRRKRDRKVGVSAAAAGREDGGREPGRFSARRKTETILRLLRGEALDGVARELGVTAATLAQWREQFVAGGQGALKSRPADERDDEIQRLRAKVGEITMNNELLLDRCHRLETSLPLAPRRRSE
jgi:transposase-like protein